jgi:acyl transferase domain-containing protein
MGDSRRPSLVALAGVDLNELRAVAARTAARLRNPPAPSAPDAPGEGGVRLLARGETVEQAAEGLAAFAAGERAAAVTVGEQLDLRPNVAFVFAGQSEVRCGMGAELYRENQGFAETIDLCSATLGETLGTTLAAAVYDSDDPRLLDDARFAQPALFALQAGLMTVWDQWGLAPDMVSGHSLGEYAAACAAGAIGVEDGVLLVGARGALTESRARSGLMAVLFAGEDDVAGVLAASGGKVSLAAVNAPEVVVVSGGADAVTQVVAEFDARGVNGKVLRVSHPFHSACIDPMLDELEEVVARTPIGQPRVPFASTLRARFLEPHESLDAAYWRRHAREPVHFLNATRELSQAGCTVFLELGPHATLTGLGPHCVDQQSTWLPSLKRTGNDLRVLMDTATKLWLAGVDVDLAAVADSCRWDLLMLPGVADRSGGR